MAHQEFSKVSEFSMGPIAISRHGQRPINQSQILKSFLFACFAYAPLFLITFLLVTWASWSRAAEVVPPSVNFSSFESENLHILPVEQCSAEYSKTIFNNAQMSSVMAGSVDSFPTSTVGAKGSLGSWTPSGANYRPNDPSCDARQLESRMLSSNGKTPEEAQQLSAFIKRCGDHVSRDGYSSLWGLIKILNVQYPVCENPLVRKVVLQLPDHTVLRGFLAMKPGGEKRPLVIFRCGIFCSAGDASDRVLMMHLFDEGPYNVLTVANMTGADFIRDNGYIGMGGLDEGRQVIEVGKLIKNSRLGNYVSSMHVVGISLGGQGVYYAAQMNDANLEPDGTPLFASAFSISSVVDLESSINDLFNNPIKGRLARWLFFSEIKEVAAILPAIGRIFSNPKLAPSEIPPLVAQQAFEHYSVVNNNWFMKPFETTRFYDLNAYWTANDFVVQNKLKIGTPLLSVAADDDDVVISDHNTARLIDRTSTATGTTDSNGGNFAAITIPRGNHGAFGMVYGWDIAGTMIRAHILNNSPELAKTRQLAYSPFPSSVIGYFSKLWKSSETHLQQTYSFQANKAAIRVSFMIFSRGQQGQACVNQNPYLAAPVCYRYATTDIPFSSLSGATPWAHVPRNATEAEAMTRWANQNLTMVDAAGDSINGKNGIGAGFKWISYGNLSL